MHLKKILSVTAFVMFFLFSNNLKAQVTIGSDNSPSKAALLELKIEEPNKPTSPNDPKNVTSIRGGLILPRVNLENLTTLEPFAKPTDTDYEDQKLLSVGLMVYNLYKNSNLNLEPSIYYWDGVSWNKILYTIY